MNQVFIVTPFGTKRGIDFASRKGVDPAGNQGESVSSAARRARSSKPANIRTDMFQKLLVADLVIADISIHNANAFYELGARHAFREKRTFLIRCSKESLPAEAQLDEVPFDLKTDRYFEYRLEDLAGSLPKLIAALKSTIDSADRDSPIFQLLPKLEEYDHEVFLALPLDFREAVEVRGCRGPGGRPESRWPRRQAASNGPSRGCALSAIPCSEMGRMELSRTGLGARPRKESARS